MVVIMPRIESTLNENFIWSIQYHIQWIYYICCREQVVTTTKLKSELSWSCHLIIPITITILVQVKIQRGNNCKLTFTPPPPIHIVAGRRCIDKHCYCCDKTLIIWNLFLLPYTHISITNVWSSNSLMWLPIILKN